MDRTQVMQSVVDNLAEELGISDGFAEASDHSYNCICPECADWWRSMGADPDTGGYGPFGAELPEIEEKKEEEAPPEDTHTVDSKIVLNGDEYRFKLDLSKVTENNLSFSKNLDQCLILNIGPHKVYIHHKNSEYSNVSILLTPHRNDGYRSHNNIYHDLGEWIVCSITGELCSHQYYDGPELRIAKEQNVSYGTAIWLHRIETWKDEHLVFVIDGTVYRCDTSALCIGRDPRGSDSCRGFGGSTFRIKKGEAVYVIDNLWWGGALPDWAKDKWPDNASFVN